MTDSYYVILEVFFNRYESLHFEDLMILSEELLISLNKFYLEVEEIRWYLNYTEDLPKMVEDKMEFYLRDLEESYKHLALYIRAEHSGLDESIALENEGASQFSNHK